MTTAERSARSKREQKARGTTLATGASLAVLAVLPLIFWYAPPERDQGDAHRIIYLHVPSAWIMFIAFIVVAAASVMVLAKRNDYERWDRIAVSAAEVGVMFATVMITTGPIWAKKAWGTWWEWDARLTSAFVLFLVYIGYLAFRSLSPPGERRARLAAVIGIVGALDIPVVHFAVIWWRTIHPEPEVLRPEGSILPTEALTTLYLSFLAFLILFAALLILRMRIEESRHRVNLALGATVA
ncbi:MAG: cytochrome c biogenesis protein CcsA [Actinomycetota bacterium]